MAEQSELTELRRRVCELETEIAALKGAGLVDAVRRSKIDKMSSEVVDSNPYRYILKKKNPVVVFRGWARGREWWPADGCTLFCCHKL